MSPRDCNARSQAISIVVARLASAKARMAARSFVTLKHELRQSCSKKQLSGVMYERKVAQNVCLLIREVRNSGASSHSHKLIPRQTPPGGSGPVQISLAIRRTGCGNPDFADVWHFLARRRRLRRLQCKSSGCLPLGRTGQRLLTNRQHLDEGSHG
jgi:hypothetical protein